MRIVVAIEFAAVLRITSVQRHRSIRRFISAFAPRLKNHTLYRAQRTCSPGVASGG